MRTSLSSILGLVFVVSSGFAASGIFDAFSIVNDQFYDLGATTGNPDYQNSVLGTFDSTTDQIRLGGQQKTSKDGSTDVFGSFLQYRIYLTAAGASSSFSSFGEPLQFNLGNSGDQQWGTDPQGNNPSDRSITILLGSLAPGNYTLELSSFSITKTRLVLHGRSITTTAAPIFTQPLQSFRSRRVLRF